MEEGMGRDWEGGREEGLREEQKGGRKKESGTEGGRK